jgi:alpha-tubulin suppressor-like RCC1 family protein
MGDSNLISSIIPVTVVTDASTHSALSNVTALAATHDFACAVQSTGAVYCWGDNSSGQLGNGNTDETTVAVKAGKVQAVGIGAGGDQSCALMSPTTGSPFNVQCWGGDFDGELGNNDENDSYAPVNAQVSGNASAIALGWSHSCAVLADVKGVTGTIQCWGYNYYGQLGNRSTDDSDVPVAVYGLSQATSLSAGEYHTCAVVNGAVYCWGDNSYGNLGDGKGGPDVTTPQPSLVSGF